jgi:hypothetical protein
MSFEVLSLVNFNNKKRATYLPESYGSFNAYKQDKRHILIDGSADLNPQINYYKANSIEYYHEPTLNYIQRLKLGISKITSDYFLFYPDDFHWIFDFPIQKAIEECRVYDIKELKLTGRGMSWYSKENPKIDRWFTGNRLISGQVLEKKGDLFVSASVIRNFHEQFSLACNVLRTDFIQKLLKWMPNKLESPASVEKMAYLLLLGQPYKTAYYKMWIPAFHFTDLNVEGQRMAPRAETNLIKENWSIYNNNFNISEK